MQAQLDDAKEKLTEAEREAKSSQELLEEERTKTARLEKEVEAEKKRAQVILDYARLECLFRMSNRCKEWSFWTIYHLMSTLLLGSSRRRSSA